MRCYLAQFSIVVVNGQRFPGHVSLQHETCIVKALLSYDNKNGEAHTRARDISCPCPVLFTGGAVKSFTLRHFHFVQVALNG